MGVIYRPINQHYQLGCNLPMLSLDVLTLSVLIISVGRCESSFHSPVKSSSIDEFFFTLRCILILMCPIIN